MATMEDVRETLESGGVLTAEQIRTFRAAGVTKCAALQEQLDAQAESLRAANAEVGRTAGVVFDLMESGLGEEHPDVVAASEAGSAALDALQLAMFASATFYLRNAVGAA